MIVRCGMITDNPIRSYKLTAAIMIIRSGMIADNPIF
jgi:hypothetical protein